MCAGYFLSDMAEAAKLPALIFETLITDQHVIAFAIPCSNQPCAWLECNFRLHSSRTRFSQLLLQLCYARFNRRRQSAMHELLQSSCYSPAQQIKGYSRRRFAEGVAPQGAKLGWRHGGEF